MGIAHVGRAEEGALEHPEYVAGGEDDADNLEKVYMFVLVAAIMLVGIYPAILTDIFKLGISPIVGLIGG